jgi:outer membrane protein
MSPSARHCASLLFLLLLPPAVHGGEGRTTASGAPGDFSQTEQITLQRAIEMALRNNLDAEIDRVGVRVARDRVNAAWGVFDPVFSTEAARERNVVPQNATNVTSGENAQQLRVQQELARVIAEQNALLGGGPAAETSDIDFASVEPFIFESNNFRLSNGLEGRLPLGTSYRLGLDVVRRDTVIRDFDRQFVPEATSVAAVTVQQPLLRNFGFGANMAEIRISRRNREIAALTWQQSVTNAIQAVMANYIDMVYAQENIRVKEEAIEADKRLVAGTQRRFDLGMMSPIDVRQAQVQLSFDQEDLITAKNTFMERQFALKRAILRESPAIDDRVFVPSGLPAIVAPSLDRVALKGAAFRNRIDYKVALQQAEIENLRLRYFKNQALPKLDLVGSYGLNGLTTEFRNTVGNAFEGETPQWSVGVVASIPLGNVTGRNQLKAARGMKEQALLRIKQTELTISVDVDTVISRIQTNLQRVETARQTVQLNEEAMKVQNKRLEQGQAAAFDIIDTQRRLFEARTRALSARDDLDKSIVQLWFATGTLLEQQAITVSD